MQKNRHTYIYIVATQYSIYNTQSYYDLYAYGVRKLQTLSKKYRNKTTTKKKHKIQQHKHTYTYTIFFL